MNDTTQYGFYRTQSNESYKPFKSNDKENKGHDEDNNGHGNGHTEHGNGHGNGHNHNDGIPIQDEFFVLMIFIGFYLMYKYFKLKYL